MRSSPDVEKGGPSRSFLDFLHGLAFADLPEDVLRQAERCLLDLLGVAAGGVCTELSAIVRDHAAGHFAAGTAAPAVRMLFDGRTVSPAGAALAGGMTIDALDAHDGHRLTKGHVGCGLLPALLALSEASGPLDGRDFLAALVAGYEIGTRAGIALHRSSPDYHTSGAWIAVACAALGARILGLDETTTRHALGIAEYHGPRSQMMRCIDHPTMLKDGSGWGAMAGVSAAYLAQSGFSGAPAVTVEDMALADIWADLGERWMILDQYFKPWPVCRWAQPAVEAVLRLKAEHGFAADEIADVEIGTFHQAKRLAVAEPRSTEEAQYSLPFPVAAALVHGRLEPEHVGGAGLCDSRVLRMARTIKVIEEPAFSTAFPARRHARITVILADGRRLDSGPVEARGDPENALPDAELTAKFHRYAAPLGDRAAAIETAVAGLKKGAGLDRLLDLVTAPIVSA